MSKCKVSIIVPVYNAKNDIKKCIHSLFKQTLKEIEIIAVNDGSTDNSFEILNSLQRQDKRLKVINQNNLGVSQARNRGISNAIGEYIGFVDADDYVESEMYQALYYDAKSNDTDIVVGGYRVYTNKKHFEYSFGENQKFIIDNINIEKFLKDVYLTEKFRVSCWNKIYKTELVKNSSRFESYNEVISEDTLFNYSMLICSKKISIIKDCNYNYVLHERSLSRRKNYENVSIRNANMINLMSEYAKKTHTHWAITLLEYYKLQALSTIAVLEINHNGVSRKELVEKIILFKQKLNPIQRSNYIKTEEVLYFVDVRRIIYYYLLKLLYAKGRIILLSIVLYLNSHIMKIRKRAITR